VLLSRHSPNHATELPWRISLASCHRLFRKLRVAHMLPNFTLVICGAVLTVLMLAVTGSGLVVPETRTRIGEMPEIGRPMMQRVMVETTARAELAALELSRRAEEIGRLRDLVPAVVQPDIGAEDIREASAPAAIREGDPEPATEAPPPTADAAARDPAAQTAGAARTADTTDPSDAPSVSAAPVETVVAAVASAHDDEDGKAVPEGRVAPSAPAAAGSTRVGSAEAAPPDAGPQAVVVLGETVKAAPGVRPALRVNFRLPRPQRPGKAIVASKRPAHHAVHRGHRHWRRAYAVRAMPYNAVGPQATQFR
jgi:hypothetical protein